MGAVVGVTNFGSVRELELEAVTSLETTSGAECSLKTAY